MNKSESKYFNTARLMNEALIKLLEVKNFEYITVKEICQKAGVNRSTFYLHYETLTDLLSETTENIMQEFLSMFNTAPGDFISGISNVELDSLMLINSDYLLPYLTFIKEHKSIYLAFYKNPACMQVENKIQNMSKHVFAPILDRFNIPHDERQYIISFYIHGCTAVIKEWVYNGCKEPIEKIERIITERIVYKSQDK